MVCIVDGIAGFNVYFAKQALLNDSSILSSFNSPVFTGGEDEKAVSYRRSISVICGCPLAYPYHKKHLRRRRSYAGPTADSCGQEKGELLQLLFIRLSKGIICYKRGGVPGRSRLIYSASWSSAEHSAGQLTRR